MRCPASTREDPSYCNCDSFGMPICHRPRIVAAAIMHKGEPVFLPRPKRHHDIIRMLAQSNEAPITGEQGFMVSDGRFVGRREAARIAQAAGQRQKKMIAPPNLYSEDLW